jgi:hypothetical protein
LQLGSGDSAQLRFPSSCDAGEAGPAAPGSAKGAVDMAESDPITKKDLEELKVALTASLTELIRDVETNLLTAFHGYGEGQVDTARSDAL